MPRIKGGHATRQRRKRVLKDARGHQGARSKLFKTAKQSVTKALQYATRDRRTRKREFRALWIIRVSAAAEQRGLSYSRLMHGLKLAGVALNRKMLSEVAIADPAAFDKLAEMAREQLATATANA
jgi:large subunit ribosomal protein L20